ncbi:plasmid mobilization protein [Streptomyces litchfieldiae]|uniref:Uncharacterized protein n=1 Tax=Streptomyces litchfieldiae TaxID=3075543 RepID=A0ABU2MX44_9ACTN|nr:hypothetical protein [Streptomyces sp. DSM 44938]MDT0346221.1 hypothetical protein [Streptomyces sp. DSM 44938]
MATKRFSISASPEIHTLIKNHADAAGLDVSAYVIAAALERIAEDERVRETFAEIDDEIAATEAAPDSPRSDTAASDVRLTSDEERELHVLRSLILDDGLRASSGDGAAA